MRTVMITGTSRGIGLEFVRQYVMDEWYVLACCRNPATAEVLSQLAAQHPERVTIYSLDVTNHEQIEKLSQTLSNRSIDLLINNAGIYPSKREDMFGKTDYGEWAYSFEVNTMATLKMTEAFIQQISRSHLKTIITITSKMGSITDNSGGGSYIYRSSKAAVNMLMRSLSIDLNPKGIIAVLLHPGWVKTDMGGPNGLISTEQSVAGMRHVISNLQFGDSGKFYAFDGQIVPW